MISTVPTWLGISDRFLSLCIDVKAARVEVSLRKYICCVGWAVVKGSDAENYEKRAILEEKTGLGDRFVSPS